MANLNRADIIGNLGSEPELKYTLNGTPVCTLSIATNRKWTDKNNKEHEEVTWHRVVVWDKQAENVQKFLSKGDPVYVTGRMQTRKYTDDKGNDRYVTEVVAQSVQFLKPKPSNRPPHPADHDHSSSRSDGPPEGDWDTPSGPPPDMDDNTGF